LATNKLEKFSRPESVAGKSQLRVAVAEKMRADCVACHNSHPHAIRKNWKDGDVAGVAMLAPAWSMVRLYREANLAAGAGRKLKAASGSLELRHSELDA
jgi:hypothetical protein